MNVQEHNGLLRMALAMRRESDGPVARDDPTSETGALAQSEVAPVID